MMTDVKKRGLGRGLGALLPTAAAPMAVPAGKRTYFSIGIEELYPSPEQPRRPRARSRRCSSLPGAAAAGGAGSPPAWLPWQ